MRLAMLVTIAACGGGSSGPEVRCGLPGVIVEDVDELFGCTTLAGSLRFGDTQVVAIELDRLRVIEGTLNFLRNPNLVDLGLPALQIVGGDLLVHHNELLERADLPSLREVGALLVSSNAAMSEVGLEGLATVHGDLTILGNLSLPQADAEAFAAGIDVGGTIDVSDNQ